MKVLLQEVDTSYMLKMQSVPRVQLAGFPRGPQPCVAVSVCPWSQPLVVPPPSPDHSPGVPTLPIPKVGVQTDDRASSWALENPRFSWR